MLTLYEIQALCILMTIGGPIIALISMRLGSPAKDSAIYPFIAAGFGLATCIPYGSYIAGGCFLFSTIIGIGLYREDRR